MAGKRNDHVIETGDWPEREGRARVLVENPDGAQLWAYAETLREAGYDVATCAGEDVDGAHRCPLVEAGHCGLVEGADVVVSTCSMPRGDRLLAVLGQQGSTPIVFEAPAPDFERYAHLAESATIVPTPVTAQGLLDAVERARSDAPPP
jgi:AmiR/NasT family two-component response regulator